MAWGISSFSFEMLLASLASGPDGAEALGPHADLGPHARRPGTAQVDFIFFGIFKNTCFFCQKWNVHQKLCPGFVSGILMSDFSRNSSCQKSIMLEISTRREGFPTGASSLLEISFLWTIKRNYTPECIQPESFWHTSFDVLSSVEGSC